MTSPAAPPAPAPAAGEFTHAQIMRILYGLLMGMFLAALDQTIVSTAIRTIGDDLHGLSAQAWVTTAYLITSTIATPLYGKLSDMFGRRPFYLFAIVTFIIGSLACSFADTMYQLAAFRAIQGIGAGGLMSLALAIIGDILPPRERAKYQGYFLAVFGTTSVLGPVIGGFFAEQSSILGLTGWRWVFLINVPLGVVAFLLVARTLHLYHERREARVDYLGAAALVIGLVPLLTVAEQGRTWGWDSTKSIACFVIGIIGILLFIAVEARMKDDALIPLRIFKSRAISVTIVGSIIIGMAMFGAMMMLPLYMQIVHGASPMKSGLMMLPLVLGMMSASIISGQITARTGVIRIFPIIGTALLSIGMFALSHITADSELWVVMAFMLLVGLGLGNCMQALTLIVQNAVSPREIGMATSSATFFRQMGGTIGVAVFLSMLFSTVGDRIKENMTAAAATPEFKQALQTALGDKTLMADKEAYGIVQGLANPKGGGAALNSVSEDSSVISRLPKAIAHPFEAGFADAMDHVFLTAMGISVLGFLVLLLLPKIELRTQSGMAAAAAAKSKAEGEAPAAAASVGGVDDSEAPATTRAADGHVNGTSPAEEVVGTGSAWCAAPTMEEIAADGQPVPEAVHDAEVRVELREQGEDVAHKTPRHRRSHD